MKKTIVISDCDGCLTDGRFIYTIEGKVAKVFGPHDADGVKLLKKNGIDVVFISADKRGFPITEKRIHDMKCDIYCVSEAERLDWVRNYIAEHGYEESVFFGDGISDVPAGKIVNTFIVPANGRKEAKAEAEYITESIGGQGAFLDLALYVIKKYVDNK